jgi:hypothetical protein
MDELAYRDDDAAARVDGNDTPTRTSTAVKQPMGQIARRIAMRLRG